VNLVSPSTSECTSVWYTFSALAIVCRYTSAPPATKNSSSPSAPRSASARLYATITPGWQKALFLVKTTFRLLGSGSRIESNVLRPITTVCPVVSFLKCFKSAGRCHGSAPLSPITPFTSMAIMSEIVTVRLAFVYSVVTRLDRQGGGSRPSREGWTRLRVSWPESCARPPLA
jgi:hypothetical protein